MQQQQQASHTHHLPGPLSTPKAFRRPIGTHAIIVLLLLSDLAGVVLWLAAASLLTPMVWWLVPHLLLWLHASVLLESGSVLLLTCVTFGVFQRRILKKSLDEAWGGPGALLILLVAALLLVFLIKPAWTTIPGPIPLFRLQPFHEWLPPSLIGEGCVVVLGLLAHFVVWRRMQVEDEQQLRSFSRAHQGGEFWSLIEQYYQKYCQCLTRFDPSPVARLKTPPTFFFAAPDLHSNAYTTFERVAYWVNGQLVINQAYIGPTSEQTDVLYPLLARCLHDGNGSYALVEKLLQMAQRANTSRWRFFLWIPLRVAHSCEQQWQALERDRVLDRDRFAFWCGGGKRLRSLLRQQLTDQSARGLPDNAVPTCAERLDHLDSLLRQEARQMKTFKGQVALPEGKTSE